MKILVIGSGGREHALVWKIAQSPKADKIYCAPGNAGTAQLAENVPIAADDIASLLKFARENKVDLTVVGPEAPLTEGIVDEFEKAGLKIFGPSRAAAKLEGSKKFAKEIMQKYHIPTARCEVFSDVDSALVCLQKAGEQLPVIKADGLAAGKGVIIPQSYQEAKNACLAILEEKQFGSAGDSVLIEECLLGEEASILAFSDGETIIPMASAQDHKRVFDGDEGPNTGGMGAYSPAPAVTDKLMREIEETILKPTIEGLKKEGIIYKGVLYAGIMITKEGPKVLEFNCRFGDPETQPIFMRLKTDLVEIMEKVASSKLSAVGRLEWDPRPAVCVVLASGGYPGDYKKGYPISGLEEASKLKEVVVFHAGTGAESRKQKAESGEQIVTAGGRALGVTALGNSIQEAIDNCYSAVKLIYFQDMHYRRDIGKKALQYGK